MTPIDHLAQQFSQAGSSLRRHLHQSVEASHGGWWIPTIAVCVVWALLDQSRRHPS